MKKEEAEKKLESHENKPLGFCPIIKSECRMDCTAYANAYIQINYGGVYTFYEESCSSPLITGVTECYNQ